MSPLSKAIEICGTQAELCRRINALESSRGKTQLRTGHIYDWLNRRVPSERCLAIEEVTDGEVTRYDLRPDVFGEAPAANLREAG